MKDPAPLLKEFHAKALMLDGQKGSWDPDKKSIRILDNEELVTLSLKHNGLNDTNANAIFNSKHLQNADLSNNNIFAVNLAGNVALQTLNLESNKIISCNDFK